MLVVVVLVILLFAESSSSSSSRRGGRTQEEVDQDNRKYRCRGSFGGSISCLQPAVDSRVKIVYLGRASL